MSAKYEDEIDIYEATAQVFPPCKVATSFARIIHDQEFVISHELNLNLYTNPIWNEYMSIPVPPFDDQAHLGSKHGP